MLSVFIRSAIIILLCPFQIFDKFKTMGLPMQFRRKSVAYLMHTLMLILLFISVVCNLRMMSGSGMLHNHNPDYGHLQPSLHSKTLKQSLPLNNYSLRNFLATANIYDSPFAAFNHDKRYDTLTAYYSNNMNWGKDRNRLSTRTTLKSLASSLRLLFPNRFQPNSSLEFALAVSAGEYPHLEQAVYTRYREDPYP